MSEQRLTLDDLTVGQHFESGKHTVDVNEIKAFAARFDPQCHLFLFIGADPNTAWLSGSDVALDAKGFVLTGGDTTSDRRPMETSRKGVFAIGDVRSGSVKRVAAAVGEGAQVVAALHAFLAAGRREHAGMSNFHESPEGNVRPAEINR